MNEEDKQKGTADSTIQRKLDFWLSTLYDLGEEVRKRRDPEYMYTVSALASFGAIVVWNVSAVPTINTGGVIIINAIAIIGIMTIARVVIAKIKQDHKAYMHLRKAQVDMVNLLKRHVSLEEAEIWYNYKNVGDEEGFRYSIAIVMGSAWITILICLMTNVVTLFCNK